MRLRHGSLDLNEKLSNYGPDLSIVLVGPYMAIVWCVPYFISSIDNIYYRIRDSAVFFFVLIVYAE